MTNLDLVNCYGNPVQAAGDREALSKALMLRGSVHTSARRGVTTALAIVSRVAWLTPASTSREAEVDDRGSDESRDKRSPEVDQRRNLRQRSNRST